MDNYYLRARYYDPSNGRFTQQDTWMGDNSDPVTLHKYAYGNLDPVNNIDPSGNFSMGSMMSAINIVGILATTATYSPLSLASGSSSQSNSSFNSVWSSFLEVNISSPLVYDKIGGKVLQNHERDPVAYENACALRTSWALNGSGYTIPFERGRTGSGSNGDWYYYTVRNLERYLERTFGSPDVSESTRSRRGVGKTKVNGKKGVILFDTRGSWNNATGHADVWNGFMCGGSCYFGKSVNVKLWELD